MGEQVVVNGFYYLICVYLNRIFVRNEKVLKQYFYKIVFSSSIVYKWSKNIVVKDVVQIKLLNFKFDFII